MTSVDKKNDLLKKLHSKELTMDQFLLACAKWGMETGCWVEYEVRSYPTAPQAWVEYENMSFEKQHKVSEDFFMRLDIREYLQKKGHVYSQNYSDYCWLKEMKNLIPDNEEHLHYHLKLDAKINEFHSWLYNTNEMVEKVRERFSGKVIEKPYVKYSAERGGRG
jgi:DNA phosphorothioation-dependent restriction protein DptG